LDSKPLYNSRIINTYIKYIKKCYENIDIDELYEYAQIEPYEVADQNHWFTQEQINRFHEKLSELTGSTNIAREAGRYVASSEAIGIMRHYVLGMTNPALAYKFISKVASNFSRSTVYEAREINPKKIEIIVTPREGVKEEPFQCENRIGHIESINMAFTNSIPKIEHTECVFKWGACCRYTVSWDSNISSFLTRTRNIIALLLAFISVIVLFVYPFNIFLHYLPVVITTLFIITFVSDRQTIKELRNSIFKS